MPVGLRGIPVSRAVIDAFEVANARDGRGNIEVNDGEALGFFLAKRLIERHRGAQIRLIHPDFLHQFSVFSIPESVP